MVYLTEISTLCYMRLVATVQVKSVTNRATPASLKRRRFPSEDQHYFAVAHLSLHMCTAWEACCMLFVIG